MPVRMTSSVTSGPDVPGVIAVLVVSLTFCWSNSSCQASSSCQVSSSCQQLTGRHVDGWGGLGRGVVQCRINGGSNSGADTRNFANIIDGCLLDARDRAEVPQQRPAPDIAQT